MYNLGEHFRPNYETAIVNKESVIQGKKYRITIMTERLIRLEYNEDGLFEDRPTELAWFRNFEKPNFEIKQDDKYLEITTKYFRLYYVKERKFHGGRIIYI